MRQNPNVLAACDFNEDVPGAMNFKSFLIGHSYIIPAHILLQDKASSWNSRMWIELRFPIFIILLLSNDSEGNLFQEAPISLATSSPALLHSMAVVAAGHLARNQRQHQLIAQHYYAIALRELNAALSDPFVARLDSTLGASLMLCVFEVGGFRQYNNGLFAHPFRFRIPRTRFGLNISKELET